MARPRSGCALAAWLVAVVSACGSAVQAQDSFDDKTPNTRGPRPVQTSPAPAATTRPPVIAPAEKQAPAVDGGETQDFGVAPTAELRPTAQLHGPTPTTIPGGKVVGTRQLAQWMQGQQGQQGKVLLLHVVGSSTHLPNAIPATPASQGGRFDDPVQNEFGEYLQKATAGDRSRLVVTYCQGVRCWGSYNAALRAIRMGYTNVHWYRGGMEAWQQAGLPLLDASAAHGSRQQPDAPARR
ncbi:MAG TPA: rhodanese-like domain-containing protein [Caldimonas sp.]|jgi:PQQ-dependent catabolism-associated CXXCW motif protein|nr:rhodanese-like domain-containing protein [Caldimonas sp.]HEX2539547.1 rhodanese-like domain-containing protein [Caldimonas sp.]